MMRAADVLTSIARRNPNELPRYQDRGSGKVFERIVSRNNFSFVSDRSLPTHDKMAKLVKISVSLNRINKLYFSLFMTTSDFDHEGIELVGAMLFLSSQLMPVAEKLAKDFDKNDPSQSARFEGLRQMKQGVRQVMSSAIVLLSAKGEITPAALDRLVNHVTETFPVIFPYLLPDDQVQVVEILRTAISNPKLNRYREALRATLAKLK